MLFRSNGQSVGSLSIKNCSDFLIFSGEVVHKISNKKQLLKSDLTLLLWTENKWAPKT